MGFSKLFHWDLTYALLSVPSLICATLFIILIIYHLFLLKVWPWRVLRFISRRSLLLIHLRMLCGIKSLVEWKFMGTISPFRYIFSIDQHLIDPLLPWSPWFWLLCGIKPAIYLVIKLKSLVLLRFRELSLKKIVSNLLFLLMHVILAHIHKSIEFSISLKKANTFNHPIIPLLGRLLLL